jgi:hypothetical protein
MPAKRTRTARTARSTPASTSADNPTTEQTAPEAPADSSLETGPDVELAAPDAPTVDTTTDEAPASSPELARTIEYILDRTPAPAPMLDSTNSVHTPRGIVTAFSFARPEPPARTTGWRHLPEEVWPRDRIRVAPWNDRVRKIPAAKFAKLIGLLKSYGIAGTLNVRAEDGLLIGASQRFTAMCQIIDRVYEEYPYNDAARDRELERLGVAGGMFRVSPILGMPDSIAAAFSIALNNREAQGDFDPVGLAEALSLIDGEGLDLTTTGFDLEQAESLLTWEPDETKQGGAKAQGAEPPADEKPAARKRAAAEKKPARFTDAGDCTLAARALYQLANIEPGRATIIRAAALAMRKDAAQLEGQDPDTITDDNA